MASPMSAPNRRKAAVELTATIDDFFSDEKDSSSNDSDEDSDITVRSNGKQKRHSELTKKKKKKGKSSGPDHSLPTVDLSPSEFKKRGKELIDFISDYMEGTRERAASVNVHPGFLFRNMPKTAPKDASNFESLMDDLYNIILPGIPQWQNPGHHAMMPVGASYASLLGSLLCDGLGCATLTWHECPASVELEMVVMNWLAELMDLPIEFHFFGKGQATDRRTTLMGRAGGGGGTVCSVPSRAEGRLTSAVSTIANPAAGTQQIGGGGIIQGSTSECLLTVLVAAKRLMLDSMAGKHRYSREASLVDLMVAYCSEQAHPGIERVCEIVGVALKRIWTDRQGIMHCNTLKSVMDKDKAKGYVPFMVIGTAGTIASASVDQIDEIGPFIGTEYPQVWFHIDASYAGGAFICREYQPLVHGVNYSDSINVTIHKWLPIHMDCACLWVKKVSYLTHTFACEDPDGPLTIPADDKNTMADFRHWGIPMMRKFKAIKIWTVFKLYGFKKLQQKIREDVRRAKELERIMHDDHRFEILADCMFGIVTFRCKRPDSNEVNRQILHQINKSLIIKMTGARVGNKFWLRFVVAGRYTTSEDVLYSWEMIKRATSEVTAQHTERIHNEDRSGMPNYKHVIPIGKEERLDDKDPSK